MVQETNTTYTFLVGGGFSALAFLVGGLDHLVLALAIFMGVDFILGCMIGAKAGLEQAHREAETGVKEATKVGLNSHRAFTGLMKKTAMIFAVIIAVQLDVIAGNDSAFMRNAMILFFIGVEGLSLVENFGKLGVSLPPQTVAMFKQLKNDNERKGD